MLEALAQSPRHCFHLAEPGLARLGHLRDLLLRDLLRDLRRDLRRDLPRDLPRDLLRDLRRVPLRHLLFHLLRLPPRLTTCSDGRVGDRLRGVGRSSVQAVATVATAATGSRAEVAQAVATVGTASAPAARARARLARARARLARAEVSAEIGCADAASDSPARSRHEVAILTIFRARQPIRSRTRLSAEFENKTGDLCRRMGCAMGVPAMGVPCVKNGV